MTDDNDVVAHDIYPLPVIVYGKSDCEHTTMVRNRLDNFRISFVEKDIDMDEEAARFVERVNHGERITPTLVFGEQEYIVVRPDIHELDQALRRAGYLLE